MMRPPPAYYNVLGEYPALYPPVVDGGDKDLQEILDEQGSNPLPENQCRYIFECMVAAVRHMHSLDLVGGWVQGAGAGK